MRKEDIKVALCGNSKGQEYEMEGSFDEDMKCHIDSLYRNWENWKTDFLLAEIKINEKHEADFYYSYIRPNTKEYGQEGREGGCCAIVLRTTKHYCEDMARLYQLFVQLFSQLVEGTFISGNHFIIDKFDKNKSKHLLSILRGQIEESFKNSFSFLKDKVYISGKTLECNVSAYGCELYLDNFFKTGSAILSTKIQKEVPKLQKAYQQKLSEQEQKHNTELVGKNNEIEFMKKQKISYDKRMSELERRNDELEKENQRQKKRLETIFLENKNFKRSFGKLKGCLSFLKRLFRKFLLFIAV